MLSAQSLVRAGWARRVTLGVLRFVPQIVIRVTGQIFDHVPGLRRHDLLRTMCFEALDFIDKNLMGLLIQMEG